MASLHDVMTYLVSKYPHSDDLANARLTKMIYLADWRAAIRYGKQVTDFSWEFNHYGPYLHDVINEAKRRLRDRQHPDDVRVTQASDVSPTWGARGAVGAVGGRCS